MHAESADLTRCARFAPPPASAFLFPVDIFEVKEKERVSREEAAARLRAIADMLAQHNDVEFERAGMRFTVHVPDELDLKIELEVEPTSASSRSS